MNLLDRSLEDWPLSGDTIDLDGLPENERVEIWQELIRTVTPRMIRALVRLPAEDTLYISRDLPGWDEIKSAVEADTVEQEAENR